MRGEKREKIRPKQTPDSIALYLPFYDSFADSLLQVNKKKVDLFHWLFNDVNE